MARANVPGQTAVDYVTIVLSPALVVGLVGSLVLFLLEVCYRPDGKGDDWKLRLQLILSAYVVGAVLVARVSMMSEIASRFWMYGSVLAFLTYLGLQSFIEYPAGVKEVSFFVNALLVAVTWWCAHRLTWDCTHVDEDADASGEGVLQAAGLADRPDAEPEADDERSLWQRWKAYRERRAKRRALGVWVVYFSLAALPLFGLGQALIPSADDESRAATFWLTSVYVGCGLGLLMTTCFLGLRRYLRQKKLEMPAAMTGAWLTSGAVLVAGLLLVGALLPRPSAGSPLLDAIDPAGAAKRKANRMAAMRDGHGEGQGQPGKADPDGKDAGKAADKGKEAGQDKGKGDQGKGGDEGKGDKDKGQGQPKGDDKGKQADKAGDQPKQADKAGKQAKDVAKGMKDVEKGQQPRADPPAALAKAQEWLGKAGPWLKWIVFGILALSVVVALLRGGLGWLANFSSWAKGLLAAWRNFWANLFGAKKADGAGEGEAGERAEEEAVPFDSFSDPFDDGRADAMSRRELVRYSFAALEAWARERGLARRPDETALEFAARLGGEVPALEGEARRLGHLHARAEYAAAEPPAATNDVLREFWAKLARVSLAPLSA